MSNIKVVKINNMPEPSKKKTKKKSSNDLDYLKNIIRENPNNQLEIKDNSKIKKNKEIEHLLSKRKSMKKPLQIIKVDKPKIQLDKPKIQLDKPKIQLDKPKIQLDKPKIQLDKPKKTKIKLQYLNKKNKKLPKSIIKLKPATKKDLDKFFKKIDRKKKIIASNIKAPKLKKSKKNISKLISSNHSEVNPFSAVIQKVIKKNKKNIKKVINKLSRKELVDKLSKLNLIDKNTKAPDNILKDIMKLNEISDLIIEK